MHVTIRKYAGCKNVAEANRIAMAELLPVLRKVAGFGSYIIIDSGNGTITSIGSFATEEATENANQQARAVVQKSGMRDLLPNPPEIITGEIIGDAK